MTAPRPRVKVFGCGGTIGSIGAHRLEYVVYPEGADHLTAQESLARIPDVNDFAEVQGEDIISIDTRGSAIGPAEWLVMAHSVNQAFQEDPGLAGVVLTQGSASPEEAGYFLHLTVKSSKPVVVTGAMRPPSAMGTDADLNLMDAVRIAACPDAAGMGVLTVLNNEIHSARDVTKSNTFRVETFRPNELGFLGYADADGEVVFYRAPTRKHTTATPFDVAGMHSLPRVDIVYAYGGADSLLVDAVRQNGSDGLILVSFGSGMPTPGLQEAGAQAVQDGIPVVLASRATAGRMPMDWRIEKLGFMVSGNLLPQKSRILLMLALTLTSDRGEIQQMFYEY